MCATTAESLLNDNPSRAEVERVDELWSMFNSTTQFLAALKQVLINRDVDAEHAALEKFLPVLAQVEADDMNIPLTCLLHGANVRKEPYGAERWKPIAQRA